MSTGSENYMTLVRNAHSGELKLPAFQRDFKWNRAQVVLLYDSVRQRYPLGSVILLNGSKDELPERTFKGSAKLADKTDTKRLVLDGQQRITAGIDLFYGDSDESRSQYFLDLNKLESAVHEAKVDIDDDDQVKAFVRQLDTDSGYCVARPCVKNPFTLLNQKHFLCTTLLRPDNSKDRDFYLEKYEEAWPEKKALVRNVVKPYFVVTEAPDIPFVSIDSDLQLEAISRIFTTLNSSGKVLTPFELVVAVLFASSIDLREELNTLRELYPLLEQMDRTGEICLQTVAMLNGQSHKKSELPRSLKADHWKADHMRAADLLNSVGVFLTNNFGMALDKTSDLIPYDSIFAPMAAVFHNVEYAEMGQKERGAAHRKLVKWVAGSALSQRYQEGVHNKQSNDAKEFAKWILSDNPEHEPTWLQDVRVPALRSVSPRSAVGNLMKCILNRRNLFDPLDDQKISFGDQAVEAHHIFPKKFVDKMSGWNPDTGDRVDLALNLMLLTKASNARFLNDDPALQIQEAVKGSNNNKVAKVYEDHGISSDAFGLLKKSPKSRSDYQNFIKLRETFFEQCFAEFGFSAQSNKEYYDDQDEA